MTRTSPFLTFLVCCLVVVMTPDDVTAQDWADLNRFRSSNETLKTAGPVAGRVVFMGDSITEGWSVEAPEFFEGRPYVNRGISGQTTSQMLVRLRPDVIDLEPEVVVILAGTNDIAGNTGPMTLTEIAGNIASMAELARANGIAVVICSVLPAYDYPWRPGLDPATKIPELNRMLAAYARAEGFTFVDYFNAMADARNGLPERLAADGVHPTPAGYAMMAPIVEAGISAARGH